MSVVYVKELWDGRRGEDGIQRKRTYTRRFEVRTDNPQDDSTVAGGPQAGALGLPRNGQPHPIDRFALMVKITPDQSADDPTLWYVSCDYDTDIPRVQAKESQTINPDTGKSEPTESGNDPTKREENPLDRPPVYKITHEQTTRPLEITAYGVPVVNSAGQPFEPPLEDDVSEAVVSLTKNYAIVDFDWLEQFVDSVNAQKWNNRPPRCCRMLGIQYEPAQENGVSFWRTEFRIKIKPQVEVNGNLIGGWDRAVIDRGRKELAGDGVTLIPIDDPPGSGINTPEAALLDLHGHRLTPGNPPLYLVFRVKSEKIWQNLGI